MENSINKEKLLKYLDELMPLTGDNWGAKGAIMIIADKIRNRDFE